MHLLVGAAAPAVVGLWPAAALDARRRYKGWRGGQFPSAPLGRHVRLPSSPARLLGFAHLALASTARFSSLRSVLLFLFFLCLPPRQHGFHPLHGQARLISLSGLVGISVGPDGHDLVKSCPAIPR
eukprot:TRINITY_DN13708_c0_g1_i1.p2 TRINITY_DN13708_c0_g1~~TRINITY_DN13708_c0_g1_i1.p2  ORF type:complete len:126 (-),score=8.37 TRINITY_DN13708_c0_g1_i1:649-1026(-)